MSNLPHPNGDALAGDLFYPGSPQVTFADSAGPNGSRAVEFGEDGYSAAVNRLGYALGKNDEYVQARLEAKIAKPEFTSFMPAGGNGGSYQFAAIDMFVGDATYLPESQAIRDTLISVLDANYNELLDTNGHKVVVKELRNAGDTTSIVGDTVGAGGDENGFYDAGAIARFQTVHPVTGVVQISSYTIPNGTVVILAHGIGGTWDSLATSGQEQLMRDALVKGTIRSVQELHAAAFTTDGSRKAIGNFDLNSNNIVGVGTLQGTGSQPLVLDGDSNEVRFNDLLATFLFNQTETSISGNLSTPTIMAELNSRTELDIGFHGTGPSRFIGTAGSLTFTGATGEVAWPELTYVRDGERFVIAASNVTATDTVDTVLVIDASGSVVERSPASVIATDLPIAHYQWDDGGNTFDIELDIRRYMNGEIKTNEITVGDHAGCDFGSTEFQEAVDLAAMNSRGKSGTNVVRVIGSVALQDQVVVRGNVTVRGEGKNSSSISTAIGSTDHTFDCGDFLVVFEDLELIYLGASAQSAFKACFYNAGGRSVFQRLKFQIDSKRFYHLWFNSSVVRHLLVRDIDVEEAPLSAIVLGSNASWNTHYITDSIFENIDVDGWSSGLYGMIVPGYGNQIINFTTQSGLADTVLVVGHNSVVRDCRLDSNSGTATGIHVNFDGSFPYSSKVLIDNCLVENCAGAAITFDGNNSSLRPDIDIRNCEFLSCGKILDLSGMISFNNAYTRVQMSGCNVVGASGTLVDNTTIPRFFFTNNNCQNLSGDGIVIGTTAGGFIKNNQIQGYGYGGTHENAIHVVYGASMADVLIQGNSITAVGAPVASAMIEVHRKVTISDNHIVGAVQHGILLGAATSSGVPTSSECGINGNTIGLQTLAGVKIEGSANYPYNGSRIIGNHFYGQTDTARCVFVSGANGVMIATNEFGYAQSTVPLMDATAIRIEGDGDLGQNNQIVGNHFMGVRGHTDRAVIFVNNGLSDGGDNCSIVSNHIHECGTADVSVVGGNSMNLIWVLAERYVIADNIIEQLTGTSTASDNGDSSRAITAGGHGLIKGNQISKNFSTAGYGADEFFGIFVSGSNVVITCNMVRFTGTQPDSNKADVITGIYANTSSTELMLSNNYVDTTCVVTSATIKSFDCKCAESSYISNYSLGGDADFEAANTLLIGNMCRSGATLVYATGISTVHPDAIDNYSASSLLPMSNINHF